MIKQILIGMLSVLLLAGCNDDENIIPSMADTDRLEELLGTGHPALVDFKDKYGTYVLYRFDKLLDFAYQFEAATDWRNAQLTFLDEADIDGAWSFLQEHFVSCYQDTVRIDGRDTITNFKKELFPLKLLICSEIASSGELGISVATDGKHWVTASQNSFTVAGLSSKRLENLTEEELVAYVRQIHYIFLAGYVVDARRELLVSDAFLEADSKLYGTQIDRGMKVDKETFEKYCMNQGFFPVYDADDAMGDYFPQALEDIAVFLQKTILMNRDDLEKIKNYSLVWNKANILVKALLEIGVDVKRINPIMMELVSESIY